MVAANPGISEFVQVFFSHHSCSERLLWFFGFEEVAGLCEIEGVSVHDEFVVAGVVGDFEYAFYLMATLAESLDEKIDIYHAGKCTGSFLVGDETRCLK